jgi:uncharacterized membrane protein
VRHAARNSPASDNGGRQVAVLIKLRELLQRLLAALGALVALWTFTIGAGIVLQRALAAGSAQGDVTSAPQQLVLIFGGVGSLLVALFYVPAATACSVAARTCARSSSRFTRPRKDRPSRVWPRIATNLSSYWVSTVASSRIYRPA